MVGSLTFCILAGLLFSEELSVTRIYPKMSFNGIVKFLPSLGRHKSLLISGLFAAALHVLLGLLGFPARWSPRDRGRHLFERWLVAAIVQRREKIWANSRMPVELSPALR
jgi:hypothetical protein